MRIGSPKSFEGPPPKQRAAALGQAAGAKEPGANAERDSDDLDRKQFMLVKIINMKSEKG